MKQTPKEVTAATQPGPALPQIQVDTLYDLKLAPQGESDLRRASRKAHAQ